MTTMKTMPRPAGYLLFVLFIGFEWAFEQINESVGWVDTKTAEGIALVLFLVVGIPFFFWAVADRGVAATDANAASIADAAIQRAKQR